MIEVQKTITPVDGSVYVERPLVTAEQMATVLETARRAQVEWRRLDIAKRAKYLSRFVDAFVARKDKIAEEITWQMGRPLAQSPGEVRGFEERARHMIGIAEEALAEVVPAAKDGFKRYVCREPLGVVLVIAPWNYPYLTAVNSVVPALMAGNTVILKHAPQTPLCAERLAEAFEEADLPEGVFQYVHAGHALIDEVIAGPGVDFLCFTGSVAAGHVVSKYAAERFIGVGLELGGKDPAYVRADANLGHAVENLVDGACFNSGQSCCAIERIYVHELLYDKFVEAALALTRRYRLGNPLDPATTLGPLVRTGAAQFVRGQIRDAVAAGARALIDSKEFPADREGTPYLAPQILVDVDHSMSVMREESFGPVVGIMPVKNDMEAIELMNDSPFGLTAAIWTSDVEAAENIGEKLETGTVFMNRCDYLDPALPWVGVKDSGRGCTLSRIGYEQLTRPKSFHLRTAI